MENKKRPRTTFRHWGVWRLVEGASSWHHLNKGRFARLIIILFTHQRIDKMNKTVSFGIFSIYFRNLFRLWLTICPWTKETTIKPCMSGLMVLVKDFDANQEPWRSRVKVSLNLILFQTGISMDLLLVKLKATIQGQFKIAKKILA